MNIVITPSAGVDDQPVVASTPSIGSPQFGERMMRHSAGYR